MLTLPNWKKFVGKSDITTGDVTLTFPNGQVFKGDGGVEPPYVSDDESLVAILLGITNQTGELHLYLRGGGGKYSEIPSANGKVGAVLRRAQAPFPADAMRLFALNGRTLTLGSKNTNSRQYRDLDIFKVHVAPDGSLALAELAPSE